MGSSSKQHPTNGKTLDWSFEHLFIHASLWRCPRHFVLPLVSFHSLSLPFRQPFPLCIVGHFWKIGCEWMHQILIFWWRFLGVLYFLYQKENMEMQVNFVDHWSEDVEKFLFIENMQRINQLINACGWNSTYVTSLVVGNPTMWLEIHPATIYSKK